MLTFLKDRGTLVSIALGLLALVVAGTGTAVAAAATVVNIADPVTASKVARVDSTGHLSVAPAPATLSNTGQFLNVGVTPISSPTSATLVLNDLRVSETRLNGTVSGSDLNVYLVQTAVEAGGSCSTTVLRYVAQTSLSSGLDRDVLGEGRPQLKAPSGQTQYCLALYSATTNAGADSTTYYPSFSWSAYVAAGSYAGVGAPSLGPATGAAGLPAKP